MDWLFGLLKDPATQTTGLWLLLAMNLLMYRNQHRLFVRQDDQERRISEVKGAHDLAQAIQGCPLLGLDEIVDACPVMDSGCHKHQRKGDTEERAHMRKTDLPEDGGD